MYLPNSNNIEIKYLSRFFDNTSECYKFFWFKAIVEKVLNEGKNVLSYEELVDEMISSAWYMVTEYHLNLGPVDTLESLVNYIQSTTSMKPSEKKEKIIKYLRNCEDKEVKNKKRTLTRNVPYRLQAPLMSGNNADFWKCGESVLIDRINNKDHLMYYISALDGMNTFITIQPEWKDYIVENCEIIKGWLNYNLIMYLQKRNPNVPGIAEKLTPPTERKLNDVQNYWKILMTYDSVNEIYGNNTLDKSDISIDHFVPWSYVAHDEFWNLHPTTKSINSSKSNGLPDWDKYFLQLVELQYRSYELMWQYDEIHKMFDKCAKNHLNNDEIRYQLYKQDIEKMEFQNRLEEIVLPVYNAAKNCGFRNWIYIGERLNG